MDDFLDSPLTQSIVAVGQEWAFESARIEAGLCFALAEFAVVLELELVAEHEVALAAEL